MIDLREYYTIKKWMRYIIHGWKKDIWFWFSLGIDMLVFVIAILFLFYGKPALIELYEYVNATCSLDPSLLNITNDTIHYNTSIINKGA